MIENVKILFKNYYVRVFLFAILFHAACGFVFDWQNTSEWGNRIIRSDYTYIQFIFWVGQPICDIIIFAVFIRKVFDEQGLVFGKYISRMAIDMAIADIYFLIVSDPHTVNRSKWEWMGYSVIAFIIHCFIASMKNRYKEARPNRQA